MQVLWRYTGVVPEDIPKNVKLMKWLPQNDLLGVLSFFQAVLPSCDIKYVLKKLPAIAFGWIEPLTVCFCAPQPIPKLESSSLMEAPTVSMRASAMLFPC